MLLDNVRDRSTTPVTECPMLMYDYISDSSKIASKYWHNHKTWSITERYFLEENNLYSSRR